MNTISMISKQTCRTAVIGYCLLAFGSLTVYAQNDDTDEDDVPAKVIKKPVAKLPSYPTMEIAGICVDAATKQPLAGIMVQALNDKNYTAMTGEDGHFVIKVPEFATALYIHASEYLSQQVAIGPQGTAIYVEMLSDKFRPMYGKSNTVGASAVTTISNTTSQTVETDIEGQIGADVRSISRSGGPGYGRICSRPAAHSMMVTIRTCCSTSILRTLRKLPS